MWEEDENCKLNFSPRRKMFQPQRANKTKPLNKESQRVKRIEKAYPADAKPITELITCVRQIDVKPTHTRLVAGS